MFLIINSHIFNSFMSYLVLLDVSISSYHYDILWQVFKFFNMACKGFICATNVKKLQNEELTTFLIRLWYAYINKRRGWFF